MKDGERRTDKVRREGGRQRRREGREGEDVGGEGGRQGRQAWRRGEDGGIRGCRDRRNGWKLATWNKWTVCGAKETTQLSLMWIKKYIMT